MVYGQAALILPPGRPAAPPSACRPLLIRTALTALLLCVLLLLSACAKYPSSTSPLEGTASGRAISRTAFSVIGTPYRSGGNSPKTGFDCSGLVSWVYAQNGVSVPRTAVEQKKIGAPVSKAKLKPGDVLVFSIRRGWHTGIYTGGGKFVHSPSRGKRACVEDLNTKYWSEHFVMGRRHRQVQ